MSGGGFSGQRIRQVAGWWSLVAFAGIPLVLVVGIWQLGGASSAESPTQEMAIETTYGAGEPVPVRGGTSDWVLWGQPADVDLSAVRCTYTAPTRSGDVPVDTSGTVRMTDVLGHGDFVQLGTTRYTATCTGGGLTAVAKSPGPTPGADRVFGVVLLLMAPVLLVLGLVARRAGRSQRT